jgi:long-chain acyl-CoA synthetase
MQVTRLFDYLYFQLENFPQEKCFGSRQNGNWDWHSTAGMIALANQVSLGLITRLGVKPGDKIVLVATRNSPEWIAIDIGIQQTGAVSVPVYPTISEREYAYIFNEAEVKYCFCGGQEPLEKILRIKKNVPSLLEVFSLEDSENAQPSWRTALADGDLTPVEQAKANVQAEDLATIIYTSGTTGEPKGVMLSHRNIVSNIEAVAPLVPVKPGDRALSFLPLCHIFERVVTYAYIRFGVNVAQTGTDNLGGEQGDLRSVKPHFFTTVPRLLEKVYEKIYNKGLELHGWKRSLFFWALSLTDDYDFQKKYTGWEALKRHIADALVFSKWRAALGGKVVGILTGSNACPAKLIRIFSAAGIPIREGYGLTEASPGLTISHFDTRGALLGTVGPPIAGVELMIDASERNYREGEGEILAHGPNIMMGYFKKPEATAAVVKEMDGKRWLCTGDVGTLVDGPGGQQFLKITDRKKELLKTSGGKYVAPQSIENKFREDFFIEQIMVVGEQRRFVSALIIPAKEALQDWCERHGIAWTTLGEIIRHERVQALYQSVLDRYNPLFSHVEQIKKFRLLDCQWEPVKADGSEGELTPTMKLKRRVIVSRHSEEIEGIYEA